MSRNILYLLKDGGSPVLKCRPFAFAGYLLLLKPVVPSHCGQAAGMGKECHVRGRRRFRGRIWRVVQIMLAILNIWAGMGKADNYRRSPPHGNAAILRRQFHTCLIPQTGGTKARPTIGILKFEENPLWSCWLSGASCLIVCRENEALSGANAVALDMGRATPPSRTSLPPIVQHRLAVAGVNEASGHKQDQSLPPLPGHPAFGPWSGRLVLLGQPEFGPGLFPLQALEHGRVGRE